MRNVILDKVNIADEADKVKEFLTIKTLMRLNDHEVNLIKLKGEYEWHKHEDEDKVFMVVEGTLELQFRDRVVTLEKNECIVVSKGEENKPIGKEEVTLLIFEPIRDRY